MKCSSLATAAALAAFLGAGSAYANQPLVAHVSPLLSLPTGLASEISGSIQIQNAGELDLLASVQSFTSPLGYSVEVEREPVTIKPQETASLAFRLTVRGDGLYHVIIPVDFTGRSGRPDGRVDGTLDLQVRKGLYSVEKYETLFVRPIGRDVDEDGTAVYVFRSAPPPAGIGLSEEFRLRRPSVDELSVRTDEAIKDIGFGSGDVESPTLPLPPPKGTVAASHLDPLDLEYTPEIIQARLARAVAAGSGGKTVTPMGGFSATGMTAQGTFDYTGLDGLLHPAWGWRVYARAVIAGSKVFLAKTNVNSDGNWSMSLPATPGIAKVEIDYEPRNIYYTLRDTDGAYYSFSSGALHTPADNKVINEYHQAAYLSNSDLVGLGEVHRDGMNFWHQLKYKGEGIDPVRDSSIAVYYPNNSYDCGNGNGPWSCANPSGEIWIIPAHAQNNVLMHELGHQLQYKYWDGDTPSGSGGSHTWTGCFTKGVALSEGFADFMLVWARRARNQDPAAAGFKDLEHPEDAGACTTKNKNEMWVAGTFWDFYDSLSDGQDTIYYTHTGATPKLYLNSGVHDSMGEYVNIFKSIASPQHLTIVDQIFTQNHQQ